ncbi:unnamed protein product, partial [Rhizoctonia solani]
RLAWQICSTPITTLVKIKGRLGPEDGAGPAGPRKTSEWVIALHDAFKLYGRPQQESFHPYHLNSLMFAYPFEPNLEQLSLDRKVAEAPNPHDDATSIARARLARLLQEKMPSAFSAFTPTADAVQRYSSNSTKFGRWTTAWDGQSWARAYGYHRRDPDSHR